MTRRAGASILGEDNERLGTVAEFHLGGLTAMNDQTQRPLVPGDGTVNVGDGEMHGAEAQIDG